MNAAAFMNDAPVSPIHVGAGFDAALSRLAQGSPGLTLSEGRESA